MLQTIEVEVSHNSNPTIRDLFRPVIICKRSINMFYQWFSVTMAYYGLLFASTSLSGDPYQNFALVVFVELLNIVAYYKLPNLIGRRATVSSAQLICGICTISGGLLIEYPSMATLQIILGKTLLYPLGLLWVLVDPFKPLVDSLTCGSSGTLIGPHRAFQTLGGLSRNLLGP